MAVITKFPINTIEEYAATNSTGHVAHKGIGRAFASTVDYDSTQCATDRTASQLAVKNAIISTFACPIETVHNEDGYVVDPVSPLATSGGINLLTNRTLIKNDNTPMNDNTFGIGISSGNVEVSAKLPDGTVEDLLWGNDPSNILSSKVFYAMELYTFDSMPVDGSLWYGARNRIPIFCDGNSGATAGKDYSYLLNDDSALDVNIGESLNVKSRNLAIFKTMGAGSFTFSMKFNSAIPSSVTSMSLFECKNASNYGMSASFVKSTKTKWFIKVDLFLGSTSRSYTYNTVNATNVLDGNWHTLSISGNKNEASIDVTAYLDNTKIISNWNVSQLTLWNTGETEANFELFKEKIYNGAFNDLYFFNTSMTDAQLAQLHSARYIGPYNTKLIKSVQGGLNQRTTVVDLAYLENNALPLFNILPTEVVGKFFIKADGVAGGERFAIGVTGHEEKFVTNIDFYYDGTSGFVDNWIYGYVFDTTESYYVSTTESLYLYLLEKDAGVTPTGKLAITMFYDQVQWEPYKLYVMGKIDAVGLNVLRLNLNSEHLEYSSRCAGITNLNNYGTASWNKNIYCAGGLSTVVGASGEYNDYASSVYKYDTANDNISPIIRCQLSTERRDAGRVGSVSYSMETGNNRIYFFGGCVNHGIKNSSGIMSTDYYETLNTVDKFNPSVDTLNSVVNARMSYARVGATTYNFNNATMYCIGGFRTEGGSIPTYDINLYYTSADKMQLATDTSCLSFDAGIGGTTAGVSRMKCVAPNGLLYMIGGATYAASTGYETSLNSCVQVNAHTSTLLMEAALPYAASKSCRGQDNKYGWIVGGDHADGTTYDSIPWTSKFEFATKTFSVADISITRNVSDESGESV